MKKFFLLSALAATTLMISCNGKKVETNNANNDSVTVATTENVDLKALAGTYEGTLPAADCPGIKTVLTLNADSTYQLQQDYIDRKDGHDEASGVLKVTNGNVIVLVRPSSGELTYYKVKDDNRIIMTDSLGNEPEADTAQAYVLTKK